MEEDDDNDIDEDEGDEVHNAKDLRMLERLQFGGDIDEDEGDEDDGDDADCFDNIDSDDDTRVPRANTRGALATDNRGDNF